MRLYLFIYYITMFVLIFLTLFSAKHHLQIFQQNSYRNDRYKNHLSSNTNKYKINIFMFIASIALFAFSTIILFCSFKLESPAVVYALFWIKNIIVLGVSLVLITIFALTYKMYQQKTIKPLVYTPRVNRLCATLTILFMLILSLLFFTDLVFNLDIFLLLLAAAIVPYLVLLANVINSPIEKHIQEGFINDAKKMLNSHKNLIKIGITGSYGKTSVKNYLTALLSTEYEVLMTPASFNTPMGVVRTIRENLRGTTQIFICEMGAKECHDIKDLCDIVTPDHSIVTAIGPQHLESFKTVENIVKTKLDLAKYTKDDGIILLNLDSKLICDNLPTKKHLTYGVESDSNYKPYDIIQSIEGTTFTLNVDDETETFTTKLIGTHNIGNLVSAIVMSKKLGISLEKLKHEVLKIPSVPHRLELKKHKSFTIIDDAFNSNPEGSSYALDALKMFDGLKIIITPGMIELGDMQYKANFDFGTKMSTICDYIILVGKTQTIPISDALKESSFPKDNLYVASSFKEGYDYAMNIQDKKHKYILIENDLPDNYLK